MEQPRRAFMPGWLISAAILHFAGVVVNGFGLLRGQRPIDPRCGLHPTAEAAPFLLTYYGTGVPSGTLPEGDTKSANIYPVEPSTTTFT